MGLPEFCSVPVLPARCQGWPTGRHLTASLRPAASSAESGAGWTGPAAAVPAAELQTLALLRELHPVTQGYTVRQSTALGAYGTKNKTPGGKPYS